MNFKTKEERLQAKIKRKKNKEGKTILKAKKKISDNYISKSIVKKKMQNSQVFCNIKDITDSGLIKLKTNQVAYFYKVSPIDLSLTNDNEQKLFFHTLSKLYRLPFTIKAYKFDEKINLNINKENYEKLIEENSDNKVRTNLLINNHDFIEMIEEENMTSASSYYFAIICKNKEALEKAKEDFERTCNAIIPKLDIELVDNKKWLIKVFTNLYYSDVNLDQIMYYDFVDLLSPLRITELPSYLKVDNQEIQMVSIKNYPLFIEHGFLDRIINLPNVKASVTIKDTIEQSKLLNVLNSSFKAVLADYNSSKNLSDVTEMQSLMNNYKLLIEQISANDERVKEVSIILAISGNKKQRDENISNLTNKIIEEKEYYTIEDLIKICVELDRIQIKIKNIANLRLEGIDLYTDLLISPWESALSTKVSIPGIDEEIEIEIPKGIQSGERIEIAGKGYKDGKGGRGKLIAIVKIMIPKNVNEEEMKLFMKLKEISKFNPRKAKSL